jgi:hypothetical protein
MTLSNKRIIYRLSEFSCGVSSGLLLPALHLYSAEVYPAWRSQLSLLIHILLHTGKFYIFKGTLNWL